MGYLELGFFATWHVRFAAHTGNADAFLRGFLHVGFGAFYQGLQTLLQGFDFIAMLREVFFLAKGGQVVAQCGEGLGLFLKQRHQFVRRGAGVELCVDLIAQVDGPVVKLAKLFKGRFGHVGSADSRGKNKNRG